MYKRAYYKLFNSITDALEMLDKKEILAAEKLLRDAQKLSEDIVISAPEETSADNIIDFKKRDN